MERLSSCFPVSVLVAAAQNSSMPTVSKDGSISSSLVPPVSSTDLTTLGDVNESKPEVSTQVTRHKNDGQANRLFDQCHLPPRTPVAVSIFDTARIYKKKLHGDIRQTGKTLICTICPCPKFPVNFFMWMMPTRRGVKGDKKNGLPGGVTPIQCITNM